MMLIEKLSREGVSVAGRSAIEVVCVSDPAELRALVSKKFTSTMMMRPLASKQSKQSAPRKASARAAEAED
jgi:hypothetical protein